MYFNTVPQIVEEQHCFQTLWNLNTLLYINIIVESAAKDLFCSSNCIFRQNLYKKVRALSSIVTRSQKKAVFIVGSLCSIVVVVCLVVSTADCLVHCHFNEFHCWHCPLNCQPFSSLFLPLHHHCPLHCHHHCLLLCLHHLCLDCQ